MIILTLPHLPSRIWPDVLHLWLRNHRTRQQLSNAAPEVLADLGLTDAQARAEVARPFWN
ncbi:MAG: DUF1127 domain-containing protein [Pseudomonadota bacterium]